MGTKTKLPEISVVVPVFNEENNIGPFLERLVPVLNEIGDYEIIFSMDPGSDGTELVISNAIISNRKIKYLKLSRRFGQPAATMAGIQFAQGKHVVVIDVDLQDPPELIGELYSKAMEGYEVVYATRSSRDGETWVKKRVAALGYKVINKLSNVEIPVNTGDFRIMSRRVVNELLAMPESHGFLRGMVAYIGFTQSQVFYKRDIRYSGKGNYNRYFGSLTIGLNGLIGFSAKPLNYMAACGALISTGGFLMGTWYLLQKLLNWKITPGLSTTVILVSFFSGIQILSLGLMGEYVSRIYDEVKNRPRFIIEKKVKTLKSRSKRIQNKDIFSIKINLQILLVIQMFLVFFAFLHAWSLQYKSADGNARFIERISFTSQDPPWMPPGFVATPILHLHHFGDWTLGQAFGSYTSPYDPQLAIPSVTPPFGLLLNGLLGILGFKISYLLFLFLTFFIWIKLVVKFFPSIGILERTVILMFYVLLTLPSINAFDRGAVHLFLIGLLGLALKAYDEGRKIFPYLCALIVISLKPYLVFMSIYLLKKKPLKKFSSYKEFLFTVISVVIINIMVMPIYSNNILEGLKNYIVATSHYSGKFIVPWVMDSASLMGFISKSIEGLTSSNNAASFLSNFLPYSLTISLLYCLLVAILFFNKNVNKVIGVTLLLSTASTIAPPSMEYTLVWASLAFIFVLSEVSKSGSFMELTKSRLEKINLLLIFTSLSLALVPYFGFLLTPSGVQRHQPGSYLYMPFLLTTILVEMIYLLKIKFKKLKHAI